MNFQCSYRETSYKQTMYGKPYDLLSSIKRRYDPNGLFWVTPGIGADDYTLRNNRLCNVNRAKPSAQPPPNPGSQPQPKGQLTQGTNQTLNQTGDPLGRAPETDNNFFANDESDGYRAFPPSQEYADKNAPNFSKGGNNVK